MRTLLKRSAVYGLAATAAMTALAPGAAAATPSRLYAPSALVLTVSKGETAATATPLRAVTLTCAPAPGGTHPAPQEACDRLRGVDGNFAQLRDDQQRMCVKIYDPVVVTAQGVWEGRWVDFQRTYGNSCVMRAEATKVFAF
ncbi:subtilase-type protease inhibitor [Streptomyces sp. NPDC047928]|uniref:subtilase-type protease inhibitor n=1 Tax=unclassified Streptomyces TaxID=2593676 RepID=UPI00370F78E3